MAASRDFAASRFQYLPNLPDHVWSNISSFSDDVDFVSLVTAIPPTERARVRGFRSNLRQRLLTYGVAGVLDFDIHAQGFILNNVFGPYAEFKTPPDDDAIIAAARTFAGARVDGSLKPEHFFPDDPHAVPAFRYVDSWWRWVCKHHFEVAAKTDLVAFLLFSAEFHIAAHSLDPAMKINYYDMESRFSRNPLAPRQVRMSGNIVRGTRTRMHVGFSPYRMFRLEFGKNSVRFSASQTESSIVFEEHPTLESAVGWAQRFAETIVAHCGPIRAMQVPESVENPSLFYSIHALEKQGKKYRVVQRHNLPEEDQNDNVHFTCAPVWYPARTHMRWNLLEKGAGSITDYSERWQNYLLKSIFGPPSAFKTSGDAITAAARTFAGARFDGAPEPERLFPVFPENPQDLTAFVYVDSWWRWVCEHHFGVAAKVDLVAYLLFSAEFFLAEDRDAAHAQYKWLCIYYSEDAPKDASIVGVSEGPSVSTEMEVRFNQSAPRHYELHFGDAEVVFKCTTPVALKLPTLESVEQWAIECTDIIRRHEHPNFMQMTPSMLSNMYSLKVNKHVAARRINFADSTFNLGRHYSGV